MSARDPELTRLLIQELVRHLGALEAVAQDDEGAAEVSRRTVHALKGSAGLAGEPDLAAAMQRLERRFREGDRAAWNDAKLTVATAIHLLEAGEAAVFATWPEPPVDLIARPIVFELRAQYMAEVADRLVAIDDALASADVLSAAAAIFRHVHTLKGAASAVSDEPMAWFCHGLEEKLRVVGDREAATTALEIVARYRAVLAGLVEDPEAALATLRPGRRSGLPARAASAWPDEERTHVDGTIRVAAQSVDALLDHVGVITVARERVAARVAGATVHARTIRRLRSDLGEALRLIGPPRPWGAPAAALRRVERAVQSLGQLGDELDNASEMLEGSNLALKDKTIAAKKLLSAMRQTPLRGLFSRLSAAALAEARRTGRLVVVRTTGGDETIDRRLAEALTEPCLQLTRNAVAHGIEPPEERAASGKPEQATISLSARKTGNRLSITIEDDGAGVDVAAVRARAIESGAVTDVLAEAADDETLLELLFLPGFSTRDRSPDLLAGRGVGLEIALASVQKLGGSIRLVSRHHLGFAAGLDVPMESGLAVVLWVSAGGLEYAIPAVNASRVRFNEGLDADRIPHLAACLEPRREERARLVLDLDLGQGGQGARLPVGVDKVGGTEEVLVRGLSPLLWGLGPFAGAIVRGDGSLRLALDVHALMPRLRALGRVPEGRVSDRPPRPSSNAPPSVRR